LRSEKTQHPDEEHHTVQGDVLVFRFRTVEAFLKAGVAPSVTSVRSVSPALLFYPLR
jgi:hypothetical protein